MSIFRLNDAAVEGIDRLSVSAVIFTVSHEDWLEAEPRLALLCASADVCVCRNCVITAPATVLRPLILWRLLTRVKIVPRQNT